MAAQRYPKPGPTGGKLIREVISFLKSQNVSLPLTSHILIATSGGADSIGLAHLLTRYGRKIAPMASFRLLHVNHQWRGVESAADADFVKAAGKRWTVPVITKVLPPPQKGETRSLEEVARELRKKIFRKEAEKRNAVVFTAHQADDFAETLLWRLFSGAAKTHGSGILFSHGVERRPLLRVRKSELKQYLIEEGETWREDLSNYDTRFLRARLRAEIMPQIEQTFPRAVQHLVSLGLQSQTTVPGTEQSLAAEVSDAVFQSSGLKIRKAHWDAIQRVSEATQWHGELTLPGGWKLRREIQSPQANSKL